MSEGKQKMEDWLANRTYCSPDPKKILLLSTLLQEELEKVQNRVAMFMTGNYNFETGSMTSILEQLGWESLLKDIEIRLVWVIR